MVGFSVAALQALILQKAEAAAHWDTPIPGGFWVHDNPIFCLTVDFLEVEPAGGQRMTFRIVYQALLCIKEYAKSLGRSDPTPSFDINMYVEETGEKVGYGDFDVLDVALNVTS